MSPEKQRVAIATTCGWTAEQDSNGYWRATNQKSGHASDLWLSERNVWSQGIPDYPSDKNAMQIAKKVLWDKGFMLEFVNLLVVITCYAKGISWSKVTTDDRQMLIANATAEQEAEAFLKVLGRWEEEQVHEPSFHSYYREDAQ